MFEVDLWVEQIVLEVGLKLCMEFQLDLAALEVGLKVCSEFEVELLVEQVSEAGLKLCL